MADAPFALIGRPLGHSLSPLIHERLGSAPYELVELEPDAVEPFVRGGSWQGLNVTIPYKRVAAQLADELSPRVQATGAANTLVRLDDGSILADNTDVLGFVWMLNRFVRRELGCSPAEALASAPVLVLGSGGASAAVTYALRECVGCTQVHVISRSGDDNYATLLDRHADAVLIVNTTPVGMYPNCPDAPLTRPMLEQMPRLKGVLDVVYNPWRTGLALAAADLGVPRETGLAMLVAQAHYASGLFQGRDLDDAQIESIEREILTQQRSVALIGMPGSGKSSAGRALAKLLGKELVDMDAVFKKEMGVSAADYIVKHGEDAFRSVETVLLRRHASRGGQVLATGGGVVTRPENRDLLRQAGYVVFLDRPIEELSSKGRPLSQARGVEQLAQERLPLYRAWADLILPCTGSAHSDARAIEEWIKTQ